MAKEIQWALTIVRLDKNCLHISSFQIDFQVNFQTEYRKSSELLALAYCFFISNIS